MIEENTKILNAAVLCGIIWGTPIVTGMFWLLTTYSPRPHQQVQNS